MSSRHKPRETGRAGGFGELTIDRPKQPRFGYGSERTFGRAVPEAIARSGGTTLEVWLRAAVTAIERDKIRSRILGLMS